MKKHFLGIVCFAYTSLILYVKFSNNLKNYLAPQMQKYILLSVPILFLIGLVMCFNNHIHYKFKFSDLVLLLPIIMIIFAGNGRLSTSLANNRNNFSNTSKQKVSSVTKDNNKTDDKKENNSEEPKEENSEITKPEEETTNNSVQEQTPTYDFSSIDYDVVDASYSMLAAILSYPEENGYDSDKFVGKKIKVRGFAVKKGLPYLPSGYFAIGKYIISCCAADAGFGGFYAKYDLSKVKENTWYEIEGILEKTQDTEGYNILAIKVININEIDGNKEEQYAYPCYSYDDGSCSIMDKYDLGN